MRFAWLWPVILLLSTAATGLVTYVYPSSPVRPYVVFWFLLVCPGSALVYFLHLHEWIVEWTLAIALSLTLEALIAGGLMYAGHWSTPATMIILASLTVGGASVRLALAGRAYMLSRGKDR